MALREFFGGLLGGLVGGTLGLATQERPEGPIDEVIQTTEEAWENNDLNISGDRGEQ